jgi:two-component system cell cycle sensor histidine kinase PleC
LDDRRGAAGQLPADADSASASGDFRARLLLTRALFNNIRFVAFANLGTMILFVALLWDEANRIGLVAWGGALALVVLLRAAVYFRFRRATVSRRNVDRWTLLFAGATSLNGLAWGATALLLLADAQSPLLPAIAAVAGFTLIALVSYAANFLAFAAFVLPSVLPYLAQLVARPALPEAWVVPLGVAWLAAAFLLARTLNRRYRAEIERQIEREDLIGKLEAARDEARRANEAKTRFLGHMSHELRTPLNAILGFSEMILARVVEPAGPKFDGYMRSIHDSGRHLLRLVSDILDLARIEAGRFALEEETVDLGALIGDAASLFRDEAAKDGIAIAVEVGAPAPKLRADPTRLRQIAYNLLSNALKYSPPNDTVRLAARRREDGALELSVSDNGQGMTAAEIAQAAAPFVQLDRRDQQRAAHPSKRGAYATPGTGLGFPLVVKLMEAHGGRAVIESGAGKGCTVRAVFPKERAV